MALTLPIGPKPPEHQAESSHWYDREGRPCYEQVTKKGGLRATDIRDARKLGLVPSVTTVLAVLAKPALEAWKVKQGVMAALTLSRDPGEGDDAYIARVLADSREQAKAAAEEGTRIHDQIERSFKGLAVDHEYIPHVEATRAELERLFPGVNDWRPEVSFASPLGYGGRVDLHSPSTGITVDYKGKDGDFTDKKRLAYDQHFQLAPYQRGLGIPLGRGANIFVSRTHPGCVASHVWTPEEMLAGWGVFQAALRAYCCIKSFDPSFSVEPVAAEARELYTLAKDALRNLADEQEPQE